MKNTRNSLRNDLQSRSLPQTVPDFVLKIVPSQHVDNTVFEPLWNNRNNNCVNLYISDHSVTKVLLSTEKRCWLHRKTPAISRWSKSLTFWGHLTVTGHFLNMYYHSLNIVVYERVFRIQSTSPVVFIFSSTSGSSRHPAIFARRSRCSSPIPAIPNTSCAFSAPKSTPSGY